MAGVVCLLAISTVRYFGNWPTIWDVSVWDETNVLASGVFNWFGPPRYYQGQALYCQIYKFAAVFVTDTARLQFVVALAVTVTATAALFSSTWLLSRNLLFATLVAAILIMSGSLLIEPRAVYAAIVVISVGTVLIIRLPLLTQRAAAGMLVLFLAVFIRPEFILPFYLMIALFLVASLQALLHVWPPARRGRMRTDRYLAVVLLAAAISLLASYFPMEVVGALVVALITVDYRRSGFLMSIEAHSAEIISTFAIVLLLNWWNFPRLGGESREFQAFGQSFAYRWESDRGLDGYSGALNWHMVVNQVLPSVSSEFQALLKYPWTVLSFFLHNVADIPHVLWQMFGMAVTRSWIFDGVAATTIILAILLLISERQAPLITEGQPGVSTFRDLAFLGLIGLGPLLETVGLFPFQRYLLLLSAVAFLVLARIIRQFAWPQSDLLAVILALAFSVTVVPAPSVAQPNLRTIEALRGHHGINRMLEVGVGWCAYLPQPCERFSAFDQPATTPLLVLMEQAKVDTVLVSKELVEMAGLRGDKEFLSFLSHPTTQSWYRYDLGDGQVLLTRVRAEEQGGLPTGQVRSGTQAQSIAPFFNGEHFDRKGVFQLTFPSKTSFGYYSLALYPYLYHFGLGWELVYDAKDQANGVYFYDFGLKAMLYTNPDDFPFLYDFRSTSWLYYYAGTSRWFYDFGHRGLFFSAPS